LLSAVIAQNSFASTSVLCPNSVTCDNNTCKGFPSIKGFYAYEILGKQPTTVLFVRAYSRVEYSPHTICSYASSDGKSQVDLGSNVRIAPDFSAPNNWYNSSNIYQCGSNFIPISPEICPFTLIAGIG